MSRILAFLTIVILVSSPAFAVQTGGAGAANPVVITGAITAEGYSKAPTLEITSRVLKIGGQTYTWPSSLGSSNSFLKDSGSGTLAWETISGTVPDPTAAGSLLIGSDAAGSWQSVSLTGDIAVTSTGVTTIGSNAITQAKMADNSVGTAEIIDGSIGASKIADGIITGGKLASGIAISTSGSISATSIAGAHYGDGSALTGVSATTAETAGSATPSGAAGGDLTGTYPNPTIGSSAVTTTKIADNNITAAKMATDSVTSEAIAAGAVATAKISDEAVTGSKLANQILKNGTLDDAAYSLTFSNEGTGTDIGLPLPMSSYILMRNSEGTFVMGQIPSQVPNVGGIGAVYSDKFLVLASANVAKIVAPELQLAIDTEGGSIRFVNDIDGELDVLTVDQGGVITAYSLPPSLYVKTTADQKLTAEAIDISSGITGTLEIQYGGTGISSYPPSGEILIGDGTNYNLRIISGDVSMNYLGNVAIRDGIISTQKLASNFILPVNRGGTGITSTPMGPQILLGYMGSYSLRTVSGDVTMDYLGNYTIGAGKITADKLASNFTLPVNRGGTSVGSFTQYGVVYPTTSTSLAATGAGAAGTVLKGTGNAPEFGQVVTAEIASGAVTTPKLAGNIDVNTTGSISTGGSVNIGTTLEAGGRVIYTPSGTETITAGGGVTEDMLAKKVILIAGDGAGTTDISANPQIAAGSNGQMIILIGTNDSNLVKFDNGNGLQLSAATSFTLGEGDILQLVYVESLSKWVEISRTDN